MHAAMCELIDDFSLVSFETLNIQDAESVGRVLARVDKANGYVYMASESFETANQNYAANLFRAISRDTEMTAERTLFVQDKYMREEPQQQQQGEGHDQRPNSHGDGDAPGEGE